MYSAGLRRFGVNLLESTVCNTGQLKHLFIRDTKKMTETGVESKRLCQQKTIGTHDGTFHCDEVLACYLLQQLPEYSDAEVKRTRDKKALDNCDIVVDVGGVYDPNNHRYDHHQRNFVETMHSLHSNYIWETKLSSAGLVYFHFGQRIIAQIIGSKVEEDVTKVIYKKVYEMFVHEIDGIDNGISVADGELRYMITTNLSSRISYLNPKWNEEGVDVQARFHKAMSVAGAEFKDRVDFYATSWWPARESVEEAIKKRYEVDSSGEIVVFNSGGCPWKDHLLDLEEELKINPLIKFILFPDQNSKWRVQCVPIRLGSFENRLSLLEAWRGVRDEELSKLSGIPGCIFVHSSGFIGGNETYNGALQMAKQTLQRKGTSNT